MTIPYNNGNGCQTVFFDGNYNVILNEKTPATDDLFNEFDIFCYRLTIEIIMHWTIEHPCTDIVLLSP